MFNATSGGPRTYVYRCDTCDVEAREPEVHKCVACGVSLCGACNRWGFCPRHALLLTPGERKHAEKWSKKARASNPMRIFIMMPFACAGMVIFMLGFILDGPWVLGMVAFFTLPLIGFGIVFGTGRGQVTRARHELERIGDRLRAAGGTGEMPPAPVPAPAATYLRPVIMACPACGERFEEPVKYCSVCGTAIGDDH